MHDKSTFMLGLGGGMSSLSDLLSGYVIMCLEFPGLPQKNVCWFCFTVKTLRKIISFLKGI